MQSYPSRRVNVFDPVFVTIGQIHAGSPVSIIPESAALKGSVRVLSDGAFRPAGKRNAGPGGRHRPGPWLPRRNSSGEVLSARGQRPGPNCLRCTATHRDARYGPGEGRKVFDLNIENSSGKMAIEQISSDALGCKTYGLFRLSAPFDCRRR
ncbi:hypothetical protein ACUUMA_09485 [Paenarthrobacter nitroguajacolicus]|uniref:hypothetical protein n=1 Tax=Paenarthrobacter nitroguajacolicus TaxID=211146 RepID=UPI004055773B